MSALLLDIGNSRLKWGLLKSATIRDTGYIELSVIREEGTSALISQLPGRADAIIACNVAGDDIAERVTVGISSYFGHTIRFTRSEARACGVTNSYAEPHRLGVDRWVAMIGAHATSTNACLIVDAGTAITIDALDAGGHHLGGQIVPGLRLMAEALGKRTSDLPSLGNRLSEAGREGDGIFANTTSAAISEGVIAAAVGAIERALRVLRQNDCKPTLLLTGGDAKLIGSSLDEEAQIRPSLVLEGLARIVGQPKAMAEQIK